MGRRGNGNDEGNHEGINEGGTSRDGVFRPIIEKRGRGGGGKVDTDR